MTSHPIFMIRRGEFKYIHCDSDPPLLFNVDDDPLERNNLAADSEHAKTAAGFGAEVAKRWDSPTIRDRVLQSQKARRTLHDAMSHGPLTSWDFAPIADVANMYVRNHMDWAEAGGRSRL
jgi:choline-sulfatase